MGVCFKAIIAIALDAYDEYQKAANWQPPTDPVEVNFYYWHGIESMPPTPDYTLHIAGFLLAVLWGWLFKHAAKDCARERQKQLAAS